MVREWSLLQGGHVMESEIKNAIFPNPYQEIADQAAVELDQDLEDAVNCANGIDTAENSQIYQLNAILDAIGD